LVLQLISNHVGMPTNFMVLTLNKILLSIA